MENGHTSEVRQLRYSPAPEAAGFGIEVLSFARLRRMDPDRRRTRPQRPDFHVLALVRSGIGAHTADFVDYPLGERSVVWIRPGVVHRWSDVEDVDGPVILFEQTFLPAGPAADAAADVFAPACWRVGEKTWQLTLKAADHLMREHAAAVSDPGPAPHALLAYLLAALVLRALAPQTIPSIVDHRGNDVVFGRYRAAVEEHFRLWHHVGDYVQALGYGPRTLTRATRAATGLGAKQFLDQRILLEAKRLLAHTDLPVARCAERVGFDDPANFTTFFQRHEDTTPRHWRSHAI